MTADDWLTATHPAPMLEFLRGKASERKLRLFAVACCRAVWNDEWPKRCRDVVDTAERFADGLATDGELNNSRSMACQTAQDSIIRGLRRFAQPGTLGARLTFAADSAERWLYALMRGLRFRSDEELSHVGVELLRDLFSPFSPPHLDPSFRTSTVLALAARMYASRDFTTVSILADALQDSGCDDALILEHLRGENVHVRGCWVVDAVLGKS